MKKLVLSAVVSLVLNAAAFVVNLLSWQGNHRLPLALRIHGGEITAELGFGLRGTHIYGMTPDQLTTHSLRFDPVSMILCLLLGIILIYLVLLLIGKLRGK